MVSYPASVAKSTRTPMVTDREKTIGVRVTAEEYEQIREKAEAMGLRVAAYVRMVALRGIEEADHKEHAFQYDIPPEVADAVARHLQAAMDEFNGTVKTVPVRLKKKNAS